jgi:hypothetical protein
MTRYLKAVLLIADLVLAAAALVGCRNDLEYQVPQDSATGERIGEIVPGQDNRSYSRGWR